MGSVPTLDGKHIHISKLPSNGQVLYSFIIRKEEEYAKSKTKKSIFKVVMSTVEEEFCQFTTEQEYQEKAKKNIAQGITQLYEKLQNLMKIKKETRETGHLKGRIESFQQSLQKTMVCWPKDAFDKSTKDEDKAFLVLTQKTDRIASLFGKDMKTYEMKKKRKKKKRC